jgi:aryl-alcohol dehydrogenase-like predicted oxidoreductase
MRTTNLRRSLRRSLELDHVAFRIAQINRRPSPLRAITLHHFARRNPVGRKVAVDEICVERLDAHAEVIHVERFRAGRGAAHAAQLTDDRDQIDQRAPGAQLNQTEIVLALFNVASEHVAIKADHFVRVDNAQHDVVDFADADHWRKLRKSACDIYAAFRYPIVSAMTSTTLMQLKTLPSTGLNVSQVCLGTMTWGEQNTESEAHAQLAYAIAQGINFIDTAEMYPVPPNGKTQGRTESFLGSWLARQRRDALIVATKVAGPGRRDWIRGGRTDLTREVIAEAVETSLARLRTDYIDLYQIHWPQRNVPMFGATEFDPSKEKQAGPSIHEQVEGMAAMIKAGKIRYYGLSNETAWGVCEFQRAAKELGVPGPVSIQNSYSLLSRNVDNDLAETLFRENMALLAYSPLAAGILSGKYLNGAQPPGARFTLFDSLGVRFRKPLVGEAVAAYAALAKERALTLVQLALGYVASRWFVGASIIGATTMAQLKEDIAAAQLVLDAETLAGIRNIQMRYPNPAA